MSKSEFDRRKLAAFLGHEPSRALAEGEWPRPDSLFEWSAALAGFGHLAVGHAALAMAQVVLDEWEQTFAVWSSGHHPYIRSFDLFDPNPRRTLIAGVQAWLEDPSSPYALTAVEQWERATDLCAEQSCQGTLMKEELVMFPAARALSLAARVPAAADRLADLFLDLVCSFLSFWSARDASDPRRHAAILRATRTPKAPTLAVVNAHLLPVIGPPLIRWATATDSRADHKDQ